MKCKNCNFTIRTNELEFIDGLECECKHPVPVQDCKHLREYDNFHKYIGFEKQENGSYTLIDAETSPLSIVIVNVRFCPFCGDELK